MDIKEIKENLCYYDKRNPMSDINEGYGKKKVCCCDNCFYGRDKLAKELLNYLSKNTQGKNE